MPYAVLFIWYSHLEFVIWDLLFEVFGFDHRLADGGKRPVVLCLWLERFPFGWDTSLLAACLRGATFEFR